MLRTVCKRAQVQKAEGVPTNNQRGRESGPCRLWGGLDKARHIVRSNRFVTRLRNDLYKALKIAKHETYSPLDDQYSKSLIANKLQSKMIKTSYINIQNVWKLRASNEEGSRTLNLNKISIVHAYCLCKTFTKRNCVNKPRIPCREWHSVHTSVILFTSRCGFGQNSTSTTYTLLTTHISIICYYPLDIWMSQCAQDEGNVNVS